MTKAILLSTENIQRAKLEVKPLAREFLALEPGNMLVIPETKQGMKLVEKALGKLEAMGYSQEDAQLLLSDVIEKIVNGNGNGPAPGTPPKYHF